MKTRQLILTSMFAALTAVGALISIPIQPVPITLQILFTLLSGAVLGSRYGALSQLVYLLLGGIGLPVFANGTGGFQVLVGPRAGYLLGFVLAAFVVGLVVERKSSYIGHFSGMLLGLAVIYIPGCLGLHWIAHLSLSKAFMAGVIPFIPGDLLKVLVAAFISVQLHKRIPQLSQQIGK